MYFLSTVFSVVKHSIAHKIKVVKLHLIKLNKILSLSSDSEISSESFFAAIVGILKVNIQKSCYL